ncbi:MAG: hypothetical protein GY941_05215 [Planctomycetes bacterium]|nr:hypothetical protein [Planctomycetota bacterium]
MTSTNEIIKMLLTSWRNDDGGVFVPELGAAGHALAGVMDQAAERLKTQQETIRELVRCLDILLPDARTCYNAKQAIQSAQAIAKSGIKTDE